MTTVRARRLAVLALAVPMLFGIAACSSPGGSPSASPKADAAYDWQLKFASCMRDQGLDYPDPAPDGSGGAPAVDAGDTATITATDACYRKLGDPPADPNEQKAYDQAFQERLKLAKCLRENGVDFPDPKQGEGFAPLDGVPPELVQKCSA